MTQVNKWLLITFSIVFVITGCLIMAKTKEFQFYYADGTLALDIHTFKIPELYLVGSIVMAIALLGAAAAHTECMVCMILFLWCMIQGSFMMLILGSLVIVDRSKLPAEVEAKYCLALPLDNTTDEMRHWMESIQTHMQCCGLFSYEDWRGNIPQSCFCSNESATCQEVDNKGSRLPKTAIYAEVCLPIIKKANLVLANAFIAISFTLGLLGTVLSSVTIYQLRRPNGPVAARMSGAAYFADPPPKYEDLQNVVPSNS